MTPPQLELWIYYGIVALIAFAACWQVRNILAARRKHRVALRYATGDAGRSIVTGTVLLNEWLRLVTHGSLLLSTGWLLVLRILPRSLQPHPLVTFLIFVSGLAVAPVMLLAMSLNNERMDRRLRQEG